MRQARDGVLGTCESNTDRRLSLRLSAKLPSPLSLELPPGDSAGATPLRVVVFVQF